MKISYQDGCKVMAGINLAAIPGMVMGSLIFTISNIALNILKNPRHHMTKTNVLAIIGASYLIYECFKIAFCLSLKSASIIMDSHKASDFSLYGYKFEWLRPSSPQPTPIQRVHVRVETIYPPTDAERAIYEQLRKSGHDFARYEN